MQSLVLFFFIPFRERSITTRYESLFKGSSETTSLASGFSQKWGWYGSVFTLAQGDITRFENITKLNLHECLTMLTFMKEKSEVETQQIKNKKNE